MAQAPLSSRRKRIVSELHHRASNRNAATTQPTMEQTQGSVERTEDAASRLDAMPAKLVSTEKKDETNDDKSKPLHKPDDGIAKSSEKEKVSAEQTNVGSNRGRALTVQRFRENQGKRNQVLRRRFQPASPSEDVDVGAAVGIHTSADDVVELLRPHPSNSKTKDDQDSSAEQPDQKSIEPRSSSTTPIRRRRETQLSAPQHKLVMQKLLEDHRRVSHPKPTPERAPPLTPSQILKTTNDKSAADKDDKGGHHGLEKFGHTSLQKKAWSKRARSVPQIRSPNENHSTTTNEKSVDRDEKKVDGDEKKADGDEKKVDGDEKKVDGDEKKVDGDEKKVDGDEKAPAHLGKLTSTDYSSLRRKSLIKKKAMTKAQTGVNVDVNSSTTMPDQSVQRPKSPEIRAAPEGKRIQQHSSFAAELLMSKQKFNAASERSRAASPARNEKSTNNNYSDVQTKETLSKTPVRSSSAPRTRTRTILLQKANKRYLHSAQNSPASQDKPVVTVPPEAKKIPGVSETDDEGDRFQAHRKPGSLRDRLKRVDSFQGLKSKLSNSGLLHRDSLSEPEDAAAPRVIAAKKKQDSGAKTSSLSAREVAASKVPGTNKERDSNVKHASVAADDSVRKALQPTFYKKRGVYRNVKKTPNKPELESATQKSPGTNANKDFNAQGTTQQEDTSKKTKLLEVKASTPSKPDTAIREFSGNEKKSDLKMHQLHRGSTSDVEEELSENEGGLVVPSLATPRRSISASGLFLDTDSLVRHRSRASSAFRRTSVSTSGSISDTDSPVHQRSRASPPVPRTSISASGSFSDTESPVRHRSRASALAVKDTVFNRSPPRRLQHPPSPPRNFQQPRSFPSTPHSPSSSVSGASTLLGAIQSEFLVFSAPTHESSRRPTFQPRTLQPRSASFDTSTGVDDSLKKGPASTFTKDEELGKNDRLSEKFRSAKLTTGHSDDAEERLRPTLRSSIHGRLSKSFHERVRTRDSVVQAVDSRPLATSVPAESGPEVGESSGPTNWMPRGKYVSKPASTLSPAKVGLSSEVTKEHSANPSIFRHVATKAEGPEEIQGDDPPVHQNQGIPVKPSLGVTETLTTVSKNNLTGDFVLQVPEQVDEMLTSSSSRACEDTDKDDQAVYIASTLPKSLQREYQKNETSQKREVTKIDSFETGTDEFFQSNSGTFGWSSVSPKNSLESQKDDGQWVDFSRSSWSYDSSGFVYPKGADYSSTNIFVHSEIEDAKRRSNSEFTDVWIMDARSADSAGPVESIDFPTLLPADIRVDSAGQLSQDRLRDDSFFKLDRCTSSGEATPKSMIEEDETPEKQAFIQLSSTEATITRGIASLTRSFSGPFRHFKPFPSPDKNNSSSLPSISSSQDNERLKRSSSAPAGKVSSPESDVSVPLSNSFPSSVHLSTPLFRLPLSTGPLSPKPVESLPKSQLSISLLATPDSSVGDHVLSTDEEQVFLPSTNNLPKFGHQSRLLSSPSGREERIAPTENEQVTLLSTTSLPNPEKMSCRMSSPSRKEDIADIPSLEGEVSLLSTESLMDPAEDSYLALSSTLREDKKVALPVTTTDYHLQPNFSQNLHHCDQSMPVNFEEERRFSSEDAPKIAKRLPHEKVVQANAPEKVVCEQAQQADTSAKLQLPLKTFDSSTVDASRPEASTPVVQSNSDFSKQGSSFDEHESYRAVEIAGSITEEKNIDLVKFSHEDSILGASASKMHRSFDDETYSRHSNETTGTKDDGVLLAVPHDSQTPNASDRKGPSPLGGDERFDYDELKCIFDDTSSVANTVSTIGQSNTFPHGDTLSPRHSPRHQQQLPRMLVGISPSDSDSSHSPKKRDEMDQLTPLASGRGRFTTSTPSVVALDDIHVHGAGPVPPPPPPPPPPQGRRHHKSRSRNRKMKEKEGRRSNKEEERQDEAKTNRDIPPRVADNVLSDTTAFVGGADLASPPPPPPPAGMKKKKRKSRSSPRPHLSRTSQNPRPDSTTCQVDASELVGSVGTLGKIDELSLDGSLLTADARLEPGVEEPNDKKEQDHATKSISREYEGAAVPEKLPETASSTDEIATVPFKSDDHVESIARNPRVLSDDDAVASRCVVHDPVFNELHPLGVDNTGNDGSMDAGNIPLDCPETIADESVDETGATKLEKRTKVEVPNDDFPESASGIVASASDSVEANRELENVAYLSSSDESDAELEAWDGSEDDARHDEASERFQIHENRAVLDAFIATRRASSDRNATNESPEPSTRPSEEAFTAKYVGDGPGNVVFALSEEQEYGGHRFDSAESAESAPTVLRGDSGTLRTSNSLNSAAATSFEEPNSNANGYSELSAFDTTAVNRDVLSSPDLDKKYTPLISPRADRLKYDQGESSAAKVEVFPCSGIDGNDSRCTVSVGTNSSSHQILLYNETVTLSSATPELELNEAPRQNHIPCQVSLSTKPASASFEGTEQEPEEVGATAQTTPYILDDVKGSFVNADHFPETVSGASLLGELHNMASPDWDSLSYPKTQKEDQTPVPNAVVESYLSPGIVDGNRDENMSLIIISKVENTDSATENTNLAVENTDSASTSYPAPLTQDCSPPRDLDEEGHGRPRQTINSNAQTSSVFSLEGINITPTPGPALEANSKRYEDPSVETSPSHIINENHVFDVPDLASPVVEAIGGDSRDDPIFLDARDGSFEAKDFEAEPPNGDLSVNETKRNPGSAEFDGESLETGSAGHAGAPISQSISRTEESPNQTISYSESENIVPEEAIDTVDDRVLQTHFLTAVESAEKTAVSNATEHIENKWIGSERDGKSEGNSGGGAVTESNIDEGITEKTAVSNATEHIENKWIGTERDGKSEGNSCGGAVTESNIDEGITEKTAVSNATEHIENKWIGTERDGKSEGNSGGGAVIESNIDEGITEKTAVSNATEHIENKWIGTERDGKSEGNSGGGAVTESNIDEGMAVEVPCIEVKRPPSILFDGEGNNNAPAGATGPNNDKDLTAVQQTESGREIAVQNIIDRIYQSSNPEDRPEVQDQTSAPNAVARIGKILDRVEIGVDDHNHSTGYVGSITSATGPLEGTQEESSAPLETTNFPHVECAGTYSQDLRNDYQVHCDTGTPGSRTEITYLGDVQSQSCRSQCRVVEPTENSESSGDLASEDSSDLQTYETRGSGIAVLSTLSGFIVKSDVTDSNALRNDYTSPPRLERPGSRTEISFSGDIHSESSRSQCRVVDPTERDEPSGVMDSGVSCSNLQTCASRGSGADHVPPTLSGLQGGKANTAETMATKDVTSAASAPEFSGANRDPALPDESKQHGNDLFSSTEPNCGTRISESAEPESDTGVNKIDRQTADSSGQTLTKMENDGVNSQETVVASSNHSGENPSSSIANGLDIDHVLGSISTISSGEVGKADIEDILEAIPTNSSDATPIDAKAVTEAHAPFHPITLAETSEKQAGVPCAEGGNGCGSGFSWNITEPAANVWKPSFKTEGKGGLNDSSDCQNNKGTSAQYDVGRTSPPICTQADCTTIDSQDSKSIMPLSVSCASPTQTNGQTNSESVNCAIDEAMESSSPTRGDLPRQIESNPGDTNASGVRTFSPRVFFVLSEEQDGMETIPQFPSDIEAAVSPSSSSSSPPEPIEMGDLELSGNISEIEGEIHQRVSAVVIGEAYRGTVTRSSSGSQHEGYMLNDPPHHEYDITSPVDHPHAKTERKANYMDNVNEVGENHIAKSSSLDSNERDKPHRGIAEQRFKIEDDEKPEGKSNNQDYLEGDVDSCTKASAEAATASSKVLLVVSDEAGLETVAQSSSSDATEPDPNTLFVLSGDCCSVNNRTNTRNVLEDSCPQSAEEGFEAADQFYAKTSLSPRASNNVCYVQDHGEARVSSETTSRSQGKRGQNKKCGNVETSGDNLSVFDIDDRCSPDADGSAKTSKREIAEGLSNFNDKREENPDGHMVSFDRNKDMSVNGYPAEDTSVSGDRCSPDADGSAETPKREIDEGSSNFNDEREGNPDGHMASFDTNKDISVSGYPAEDISVTGYRADKNDTVSPFPEVTRVMSEETELEAAPECFSSHAALSKFSAQYGSLLVQGNESDHLALMTHGLERSHEINISGACEMELPLDSLPMIPCHTAGSPEEVSPVRIESKGLEITQTEKSNDTEIENREDKQEFTASACVVLSDVGSPRSVSAQEVGVLKQRPLNALSGDNNHNPNRTVTVGEDHLPASASKILHDVKMAEKIDIAISVAAELFDRNSFPPVSHHQQQELSRAESAHSPIRDSVQNRDVPLQQEEKTPRAKTRVEKTLIFPPGQHPSPFEKCVKASPEVLGTVLSFLGDPAAVCKVKAINRECRNFVEEHMHDLIQQAVRLGGISMRMRPAFWMWVAMEQFSEASRDLRACAAEGESTELERLEHKGRSGKWHQVIERDVSRSFGNLPPHKTGARLRTDSIVRALVTWGKSRTLKRGVRGSGNPPPPSSDPSQEDQSDNDSISLAPTDTVSDWGGVTPVGSFANTSFELDADKKGIDVVGGAKVNDEMALSGNALTEATKAILQRKLSFVLHALAAAHPEVGYCQGMDYVVAHLLRLMQETVRWGAAYKRLPGVIQLAPDVEIKPTTSEDDVAKILATIDESLVVEEACFRMMDTFFTAYNLGHFYWPELRCLKTCCLVFEKLIHIKLPVLADHFEHHELNVGLFALGWFQTLFLYLPSMPTATVSHMWDIWLVERSFKIYFRVAVAILFLSQPILLNHELDGMMSYLNTFPDATLLSPDILIACALQIKVTNKLLMELEQQVAEGV